jgi:hypothetical protein
MREITIERANQPAPLRPRVFAATPTMIDTASQKSAMPISAPRFRWALAFDVGPAALLQLDQLLLAAGAVALPWALDLHDHRGLLQ